MKKYVLLFACDLIMIFACNTKSEESSTIDDIISKQMVYCIATNVGGELNHSIDGVNLVNISFEAN